MNHGTAKASKRSASAVESNAGPGAHAAASDLPFNLKPPFRKFLMSGDWFSVWRSLPYICPSDRLACGGPVHPGMRGAANGGTLDDAAYFTCRCVLTCVRSSCRGG